jgi:hypothetical protein
MMGSPTSWTLLPLVTIYAHEKVVLLHNRMKCLTWGDDGLMRQSAKETKRHTEILVSLGSEVSASKDYWAKCRGVFTEILIDRGKSSRDMILSPFVSPGYAVRENDWTTCPESVTSLGRAINARPGDVFRLLSHCKFRQEWREALRLRIPVHLPRALGGIGLPGALRYHERVAYHRGADLLSQMSREDYLLGKGTLVIKDPLLPSLSNAYADGMRVALALYRRVKVDKEKGLEIRKVAALCCNPDFTRMAILDPPNAREMSRIPIPVFADKLRKRLPTDISRHAPRMSPECFLDYVESKHNVKITRPKTGLWNKYSLGLCPSRTSPPINMEELFGWKDELL